MRRFVARFIFLCILIGDLPAIPYCRYTQTLRAAQPKHIRQNHAKLETMKLYKRVADKIHFWETWDIDNKTGAVHKGIIGPCLPISYRR